ncbi:MAG: hypothetical protein ABF507_04320, partial [Bifidobacterium aquikefiri]
LLVSVAAVASLGLGAAFVPSALAVEESVGEPQVAATPASEVDVQSDAALLPAETVVAQAEPSDGATPSVGDTAEPVGDQDVESGKDADSVQDASATAFVQPESAMQLESQPAVAPLSAGDVAINASNFPDATFRAYVAEQFDKDSNGALSATEISQATEVEQWGYLAEGVRSLDGIEYLSSLESLTVEGMAFQSLNLSRNTVLHSLTVTGTGIVTLDLSANTALDSLTIRETPLNSLDVTSNTALTRLTVARVNLRSLDVSANTALAQLAVSAELTSLDLSYNRSLTELDVLSDALASLDLSQNSGLTYLYVHGGSLTSLNLSNNTQLTDLYIDGTNFTSLDVLKSLSGLKNLFLRWNDGLSSLDLSGNAALKDLTIWGNNLMSLDISHQQLSSLRLFESPLLAIQGIVPTDAYIDSDGLTAHYSLDNNGRFDLASVVPWFDAAQVGDFTSSDSSVTLEGTVISSAGASGEPFTASYTYGGRLHVTISFNGADTPDAPEDPDDPDTPSAPIAVSPLPESALTSASSGVLSAASVATAGSVYRVYIVGAAGVDEGDRLAAFIYSTPVRLKSTTGLSDLIVQKAADGRLFVDVVLPADYSGDHKVALYDEDGELLGWVPVKIVVPVDDSDTDKSVQNAADKNASNAAGGAGGGSANVYGGLASTGVETSTLVALIAVFALTGASLAMLRRKSAK